MPNDPRRPFLRVYYKDLKRDYPDVWFDPTCLSTWVRLLAEADEAWPAPAELPRAIRRADVALLERLGLVTVLGRGQYTMKGYEAERSQRTEKARSSANARYGRSAVAVRSHSESIPPRARASDSVSELVSSTEGVQGEPDAFEAYVSRTNQVPGPKIGPWLNDLTAKYGDAAVAGLIGSTPLGNRAANAYLRAIADELALQAHRAEKAEAADERRRNAAKRAPIAVQRREDISDEEAERLAAEFMGGAA